MDGWLFQLILAFLRLLVTSPWLLSLQVMLYIYINLVFIVFVLVLIWVNCLRITGCYYSNILGGLKSYENPKNKITAIPANEEEICGATFKVIKLRNKYGVNHEILFQFVLTVSSGGGTCCCCLTIDINNWRECRRRHGMSLRQSFLYLCLVLVVISIINNASLCLLMRIIMFLKYECFSKGFSLKERMHLRTINWSFPQVNPLTFNLSMG